MALFLLSFNHINNEDSYLFQIISDGSCDLTPEQLEAAGVVTVPFYVMLDGKTFQREGTEISVHDFFDYCIRHPECCPRTSMPSVQDFVDAFTPFLEQGTDILCYCITKNFSGSYNSAMAAREMLQEKYPEREIVVEDSALVTGLLGVFLMELSEYARKGHSLKETWKRGEEIKKNSVIYFTIENLTYLAKGGRIGKVTELAARSLSIRPVICFRDGELSPVGISVGRKQSFVNLSKVFLKDLRERTADLSKFNYGFGWGFDREEAEPCLKHIQMLLNDTFGSCPEFVPIQLGATIGTHTGPYPVGLGFIEKA